MISLQINLQKIKLLFGVVDVNVKYSFEGQLLRVKKVKYQISDYIKGTNVEIDLRSLLKGVLM